MLHGLHFLRQDFVIFNIFGCKIACLDHLVCSMARNYWKLDHTSDSLQIIDSECIYVAEWKLDWLCKFWIILTGSQQIRENVARCQLLQASRSQAFRALSALGKRVVTADLRICRFVCSDANNFGASLCCIMLHTRCLSNQFPWLCNRTEWPAPMESASFPGRTCGSS